PVRIVVDADQPMLEHLRPGMSVVVSIDTSVEGDVPPDPAVTIIATIVRRSASHAFHGRSASSLRPAFNT
ncbi:hypothetical protein C6381_01625, partial [Pseudomonas syringae pv. actinidiae]